VDSHADPAADGNPHADPHTDGDVDMAANADKAANGYSNCTGDALAIPLYLRGDHAPPRI